MSDALPVPGPRRRRLAVVAAALSVLAVLLGPSLVVAMTDLAPPQSPPGHPLTERAAAAARLPGAVLVGNTVIVTLSHESGAAVLGPAREVRPEAAADQLVPLGVSGVVPMTPATAPRPGRGLAVELTPVDRVLAGIGPLVAGCLTGREGGDCAPTLLTRHANGYFRFPGRWGSASFLADGTPMEAEVVEVVGGWLLVGGVPGTDSETVRVRLRDGRTVTAFSSPSVAPGDTVFWASAASPAVEATAYDTSGRRLSGWTTR